MTTQRPIRAGGAGDEHDDDRSWVRAGAGRRPAIESVSASITVPTGTDPLLTLHSVVGGRSSPFMLPLTYIGPAEDGDEYRVEMMVRLHVDGNGVNGPEVEGSKSVFVPGASCTVDLSGYLIEK